MGNAFLFEKDEAKKAELQKTYNGDRTQVPQAAGGSPVLARRRILCGQAELCRHHRLQLLQRAAVQASTGQPPEVERPGGQSRQPAQHQEVGRVKTRHRLLTFSVFFASKFCFTIYTVACYLYDVSQCAVPFVRRISMHVDYYISYVTPVLESHQ